jgi:viologen exporter family transport system permease protein
MSARDRSALAAFFLLGWRTAAAERATTFGRIALLALILFIFWSMWRATPLGELGSDRLTVEQLFWYLAATEAVAMCVGYPYRNVEADIQSGELASSLVRPVHYTLATLVNWIGETTQRFIAVLGASIVCGLLATHRLPVDALTGVLLIAALWVSSVMLLLWQFCIGLLSTWMTSSAPAFWVWQKLFFVLGGLMIPLTLYPTWLQDVALATPFAAMLFLPASLTFDTSATNVATVIAAQAFWVGALCLLTWFMSVRAERHVRIHGA